MNGVLTVAARELRSLFRTPLAWLMLAGASFILAWIFLWFVQGFLAAAHGTAATAAGVTALIAAPTMSGASLVLSVLTPLVAMRLVSEEKRNGTITLLRSSPVSTTAIVVGKFLALLVFLWVFVAIVTLMPLTLSLGTSLDLGALAAGALGLALLAAAFGAICLFMSALTNQPVLAAFGGFGVLLLLWILNLAAAAPAAGASALRWLAFEPHLAPLLSGAVGSQDLSYFLIVTALFLALAVWKLDAERLGG